EQPMRLNLGPIGSYSGTYRYTPTASKGPVQVYRLEMIDFRYTQPQGDAEGLPFKIKAGDLRGEMGQGEFRFNRERGRVESSSMHMKISGKLSIEVGGQVVDVQLDQVQTSTVRSLGPDTTQALPGQSSTPGQEVGKPSV